MNPPSRAIRWNGRAVGTLSSMTACQETFFSTWSASLEAPATLLKTSLDSVWAGSYFPCSNFKYPFLGIANARGLVQSFLSNNRSNILPNAFGLLGEGILRLVACRRHLRTCSDPKAVCAACIRGACAKAPLSGEEWAHGRYLCEGMAEPRRPIDRTDESTADRTTDGCNHPRDSCRAPGRT